MSKMDLPAGWVDLKGRPFPTWPVVLNEAHDRGLCGITTELLQRPTAENGYVAIVMATARFSAERFGCEAEFSALGDASPANVGAFLVPALIRMAETRAKGRALRDACNIGQTLIEEIGPDAEPEPRQDAREAPSEPRTEKRARYDPRDARDRLTCSVEGCGVVLTRAQLTYANHHAGRALCPFHMAEFKKGQPENGRPAQMQGA